MARVPRDRFTKKHTWRGGLRLDGAATMVHDIGLPWWLRRIAGNYVVAVRWLLATVLFFVRCVLQSSCRDVRVRRVMTRCVVSGAWCHQALVQPSTCMHMQAVMQ